MAMELYKAMRKGCQDLVYSRPFDAQGVVLTGLSSDDVWRVSSIRWCEVSMACALTQNPGHAALETLDYYCQPTRSLPVGWETITSPMMAADWTPWPFSSSRQASA